jgi:hypothetical protein
MPVSSFTIADVRASSSKTHVASDLETLFPEKAVQHDVTLSGHDEWRLLAALTAESAAAPISLQKLDLRRFADGGAQLRCRLGGIGAAEAEALRNRLAKLDHVASAQIEHLILSAR